MDYKAVIESRYNRQKWQELLHDIFGNKADLWANPYEVQTNNSMSKQAYWLGTITLTDGETISIYEVELSDTVDLERNRRGIRDMLLTEWRNRDAGAFMFCYRKNESVLRFSYVCEAWTFAEDGTYQKESTDTKRFTYLLGEGHRSRTAIQQFEELKRSSLKLKDLTKAFSVEAVSKMFFDDYKKNYEDIIQYITGKRMVKVSNKWEEKVIHEPCREIMSEFAHFTNPEKAVRDYVKKLMGRLVFLQFLQKKGWLGVKNGVWGNGDSEFILTLFRNCNDKDHFVDNVLEALFNELNTEHDIESSRFKVPYLNGGLFEREATDETNFPLPAKYMRQMLDFFASYNFTIDENDPDDAEVGVDPEMLGRIFENLLEDNKDKGAFYTPKEIVTYMCRESLIAYLQTDVEDEVVKEAIRQFVTTHEKNDQLPADTDQKLKDVKICDPAIGSGAFPMGLLKELFQCRTALEGIDQSKAAEIKKHIIQNNIYGVDIERGAVDIARLRFWLSLIVDEESPQALPNLDYKIVEGNSLITTFDGQYIDLEKGKGEARFRPSLINIQKEKKALLAEQKRFFTLTGDEKYRSEIAIKRHILNTIWYQLDFEKHSWHNATIEQAGLFGSTESKGRKNNKAQIAEFTQERQKVLEKCEKLMAELNDESKSLQEKSAINIPFFDWKSIFPDIFDDEINGGFNIVIGNPPYVLISKEIFKKKYEKDYKYQEGKIDLYRLFIEKGIYLCCKKGVMSLITPNTFLSIKNCTLLRHFLIDENCISFIDNYDQSIFDASVNSVIFQLLRNTQSETIRINLHTYQEIKTNYVYVKDIRKSPFIEININADDLAVNIKDKMIKSSVLVKDIPGLEMCLGAQPYHNSIHTKEQMETKFLHSNYQVNSNYVRDFGGKHFTRYIIDKDPQKWIDYSEEFYTKPDKRYFDGPRIVVREIPSETLICAYVDDFALFNKSVFIIRSNNPSVNLLYLLAVLNSKAIGYFISAFGDKSKQNLFPRVSMKMLKQLPIPNSNDCQGNVVSLVKDIIALKKKGVNTSILESNIDKIIYHLFKFSYEDILIVDPDTPITREEYESKE